MEGKLPKEQMEIITIAVTQMEKKLSGVIPWTQRKDGNTVIQLKHSKKERKAKSSNQK